MKSKKPLILLVGPTAVGKTNISIELAKTFNGEIISADSMQIYKNMDIGTAKIKKSEMQGIRHYLVDTIYPNENFSVSDFQKKAKQYIELIYSRKKIPLIVGGTGLYVNSIVYNLDFTNAVSNKEIREYYKELINKKGKEYVYEELKMIDEKSAERIHINDTKRIIRALEIYHETGKPMSYYYNKFREPNNNYNLAFIGLNMNRKKLYERINKRVDLMIKEGLVDEVKNLLNQNYSKNLTSLQGLGYKEIIRYLEGEYKLEEAIDILKRDTRRFAKRQLTWFKRDKRIKWINVDDYDDNNKMINYITKYIEEKLDIDRIYNI